MIFLVCQFLSSHHWKAPLILTSSSTRMMLAALTSLILTITLGPRFIRRLYQLKTGQSIRVEDCPMLAQLHEKKKSTPSMGGLFILFSIFISLILWMDLSNSFTLIFSVTLLWLGSIGAFDDYLKLKYKSSSGLSRSKKFLAQMIFGCLIGCYSMIPGAAAKVTVKTHFPPPKALEHVHTQRKGFNISPLSTSEYMTRYYVPFYKKPIFELRGWLIPLAILITIFVITGASNSVNFTDGLDGLASGCIVLAAAVLALVAFISNHFSLAQYMNLLYIEGAGEIAVFLSATIGACLGFLWYNAYPAQVFMGDTGSLALGGILGVAAVLLRKEALLAIVGGIFVMEAISVILQIGSYKFRKGKRIFLCAPLHHHFEYKGWPENKIIIRFWIIGLLLAVIGTISLKLS